MAQCCLVQRARRCLFWVSPDMTRRQRRRSIGFTQRKQHAVLLNAFGAAPLLTMAALHPPELPHRKTFYQVGAKSNHYLAMGPTLRRLSARVLCTLIEAGEPATLRRLRSR